MAAEGNSGDWASKTCSTRIRGSPTRTEASTRTSTIRAVASSMRKGGCGCEASGKGRMKLMAGACVALLAVVLPAAWGAPPQEAAARAVLPTSIDAHAPRMAPVAHDILELPELGLMEPLASTLLEDDMAAAGLQRQARPHGRPHGN